MLKPEERIAHYKDQMDTQIGPHHFAHGRNFEKCTTCTTYDKCLNHEALEAYEAQLKMYISKLTYPGPDLLGKNKPIFWVDPEDGEIIETEVLFIKATPDAVEVTLAGGYPTYEVSPEDLFWSKEDAIEMRKIRKFLFDARFVWNHKDAPQKLVDEFSKWPYCDFMANTLYLLYQVRLWHLLPEK